MNAANTADGTHIQLWTCNGTNAQQWTWNTGDSTIRALGKCMDVAGGGTANGTKVQLWTCNGTGAQVWQSRCQRLAAQPAVGPLPRRSRPEHGQRDTAPDLGLQRHRRAGLAHALTLTGSVDQGRA